mgnify:CR=1 FL=1
MRRRKYLAKNEERAEDRNPKLVSDSKDATQFTFLLVGIWWILFSQLTIYFIPEKSNKIILSKKILLYGTNELIKAWNYIKSVRNLKLYLLH